MTEYGLSFLRQTYTFFREENSYVWLTFGKICCGVCK